MICGHERPPTKTRSRAAHDGARIEAAVGGLKALGVDVSVSGSGVPMSTVRLIGVAVVG